MLRMKFLSQKLIAVSSAEVVLSLPEKPTSSILIVKYTMWPLARPIYPFKLSPLLCEIETLCHYFYTPGEKYSNVNVLYVYWLLIKQEPLCLFYLNYLQMQDLNL